MPKIKDVVQDLSDTKEIKIKSVRGVFALISRQYVVQGFALVANLLFGILLSPAEYATYFIVLSTVAVLNIFSDIGLAAALIQKKSNLTRKDLVTTFTIQQTITLLLMALAFAFTGFVTRHFSFSTVEIYLYYALIFSFFLANLKTIPSILLERELAFGKLIIPQIVEHFVFYGIAVTLAWLGFGVASFIYAVIFRGLTGLVTVYLIKPWLPGLAIDIKVAKRLMSFGAPFQLNSILAYVKDDLWIAFLGGYFARTEMGYITWAMRWTKMPLTFFVNSVLTITFPVFSRLQADNQELSRAINKSMFFVSSSVFPAVIGMAITAPVIFSIIPGFEKWLPSTTAIYFFSATSIIGSISTILTNTLNSIGKVKRTLGLMIMWIVLIWTFTIILMDTYGYNGVAIAAALTSSSSIIVIPMVRRYLSIEVFKEVLPAFVSSVLMILVVLFFRQNTQSSFVNLALMISLGAATYLISMFVLFGHKTLSELRSLINLVKLKKK